jgi:type II secretory pathway pseudopilin PulG
MSRGFTLLEVIVALLVLEIAIVGTVSTLLLASSTLARAEAIERIVATSEGLVDSLAHGAATGADSLRASWGRVVWVVDSARNLRVTAVGPSGDTVVDVRSVVSAW